MSIIESVRVCIKEFKLGSHGSILLTASALFNLSFKESSSSISYSPLFVAPGLPRRGRLPINYLIDSNLSYKCSVITLHYIVKLNINFIYIVTVDI